MLVRRIGFWTFLRAVFFGSAAVALENVALRHQLLVLQRSVDRPRLARWDRVFWVWLSRLWASWRSSLLIVQPATVLAWHRRGFRLYWRWKSRPNPVGVERMGIREVCITPRSPWQNPFVERLIGSIRRECLDHALILTEAHLRRLLRSYVAYYNRSRPHRALENNSPFPRAVQPPSRGWIRAIPEVGGLHHRYQRVA